MANNNTILTNEEMGMDKEYITRGALLACECGSHMRRLNLIKDHGEIIYLGDEYKYPMIDESDCEFGEDKNIGYFGICSSSKCQNEETVVLKKYTPYGETQSEEIVEGPKCNAVLESKWRDVKSDAYVKDNEAGIFELSGIRAEKDITLHEAGYRNFVTMNSCLYCTKGEAFITPQTSGLEYHGEQDG